MDVPILIRHDAHRLLEEALADARNRASVDSEMYSLHASDRIVRRGQETFAVFGFAAFILKDWVATANNGRAMAMRPALVDGQAYLERREDGRAGVLHFMFQPYLERWIASFSETGWLWTIELGMSQEEIHERIDRDIKDGALYREPRGPGPLHRLR